MTKKYNRFHFAQEYKTKLEERRRLGRRQFKKPTQRTKTEVAEDPNPKLPFIVKGNYNFYSIFHIQAD